jgi:hypothetical protein
MSAAFSDILYSSAEHDSGSGRGIWMRDERIGHQHSENVRGLHTDMVTSNGVNASAARPDLGKQVERSTLYTANVAQHRRIQGRLQYRWQPSYRCCYRHYMIRHAVRAETYEAQLVKVPKAAYLSTKGSCVM